jgi:hypothetical protein
VVACEKSLRVELEFVYLFVNGDVVLGVAQERLF